VFGLPELVSGLVDVALFERRGLEGPTSSGTITGKVSELLLQPMRGTSNIHGAQQSYSCWLLLAAQGSTKTISPYEWAFEKEKFHLKSTI
jgi:hypothetical protein